MPPPKAPPPARQSAPPPAPAKTFKVQPRQPVKRAPIVLFNALEGWGKTSLAAHAPSPLILMAPHERGYDTLLSHGLVPQVPAAVVDNWPDALGWVRSLADDTQGVETLVLDAIGGFEHLCREHVCERDFRGDWGESGFAAYGKGYAMVEREWKLLIAAIEHLRNKRDVQVILLGHMRIESFDDPNGPKYNRYACDVHKHVWGLTSKFVDAVLFGKFHQIVKSDRSNENKSVAEKKGKAIGEAQRVIVTERRDGFDAKNQFSLPGEIWITTDAAGMYAEVWQHINKEQ